MTHRSLTLSCALAFWLMSQPVSLMGEERPTKELKGLDDNKVLALVLGKSPNVSFLLWKGHAVIVSEVSLQTTEKADVFKAKIVNFYRLSYDLHFLGSH